MSNIIKSGIILYLFVFLSGCGQQGSYAPGDWLGRWTGPEGTYLDIGQVEGHLEVIINDLDGPKTYRGTMVQNHIEFERAGLETIRKGRGEETGMKWLLDKQNCLVVKAGEGYCRD